MINKEEEEEVKEEKNNEEQKRGRRRNRMIRKAGKKSRRTRSRWRRRLDHKSPKCFTQLPSNLVSHAFLLQPYHSAFTRYCLN